MPDPNDLVPTSMRLDQTATIDADAMKHFTIRLKNESDAHQLRLKNTVTNKFIEVSKTLEINSSEYKTYRVDMTNDPNWTGQIGPVYLQFRSVGRAIPIHRTAITIDEVSFTSTATLSLNSEEKNNIKFLINQNTLEIKGTNSVKEIDIYNIRGQQLITKNNISFIDVSILSKGIYISKILLDNDQIVRKIFIKE